MRKIIYHTVENKNNDEYIVGNAPFECSKSNAWLGRGYYFWESFIENSMLWGKLAYHDNYVICKSEYDFNYESYDILNLIDNAEQLRDFESTCKLFLEKRGSNVVVAEIISILIQEMNYKAIRCLPSKDFLEKNRTTIKFRSDKNPYMDLHPTIQVCFKDLSMIKRPLEIIEKESLSQNIYF